MSKRNFKHRHVIFQLILKFEDMLEKGRVRFPDEDPYHNLIDYYEHEYLLERALEVTDHALVQYGQSADFYLRKAELLLENNQAELALALLDQVDALLPDCLSSSLLRAEALAALDMHDEAIALLESIKDHNDPAALSDIYVCEGLIFEQMKDYERMFFVLKAALRENPTNDEALSRMWYCVEYARKYEESVELHERILDEYPYCSLAWYNLGAAHHYLCNHEKAIEAYEYAFLTREDFHFAYRDCAEVCLYVQDYMKALQCYQEVLERFEPDADLFLHIGLCYKHLGNPLLARTFYEKAVVFDPWCDEAHFRIGECYAAQKQWQKAISAYLKAIRIEDRHEEYYAGLGEAYCKVGNLKKAETFLREAADIAPDDAAYWIKVVRFLMDQGRIKEAIEVLDEAEEYTYDTQLLYVRSVCLLSLGKKREAYLVLEEALCEDFEAHNSLFHLMPVLEQDKEVRAMIAVFQPE
ncbi:MAG: tetratricopeptide repeat protein [Saprospiraceae bacterium]